MNLESKASKRKEKTRKNWKVIGRTENAVVRHKRKT